MPGLKKAIHSVPPVPRPNSNTHEDKPGLDARGRKRSTYKNINVHFHNVSQVHALTRKAAEEKFSAMAHRRKGGGREQRGGTTPRRWE